MRGFYLDLGGNLLTVFCALAVWYTKTDMKTTVKHVTTTRVLVTVKLGEEELKNAEQVALKKLAKDMKVAGFRKGKVPVEVAAKHADPALLNQQLVDDAISRAVAESFLEKELQALDRPQVEVKKYVPKQELEFTAEADVLPKVKLGDYKKLKAEKEKVSVTKKDVDEIIDRICKNFAEKKEVKRAAKSGDEAVIDFVGKKDGTPFDGGTGNDYPLVLGSNSFIPGFEEAIVGHKAGEEFDIELTFPKEYHVKDLAGQPVVFTTTLKKIQEVVVPELTDEIAAKAGPFTSGDELRADIKREITEQKKREADEKLKDSLVRQLVEKSTADAPDVLVEDQMKMIEQDVKQNLMQRGMTLEQYAEAQKFADADEWREKEAKPGAKLRVQTGLVLAELTKELKIEASADELAAQIDNFKQQYASQPETLKRFEEPEIQREIANRLLTEKTIDQLVVLNTK